MLLIFERTKVKEMYIQQSVEMTRLIATELGVEDLTSIEVELNESRKNTKTFHGFKGIIGGHTIKFFGHPSKSGKVFYMKYMFPDYGGKKYVEVEQLFYLYVTISKKSIQERRNKLILQANLIKKTYETDKINTARQLKRNKLQSIIKGTFPNFNFVRVNVSQILVETHKLRATLLYQNNKWFVRHVETVNPIRGNGIDGFGKQLELHRETLPTFKEDLKKLLIFLGKS